MPYSYEKPHGQAENSSPAQPAEAGLPAPEDVRFRSTVKIDDEMMKEVANCFYRPYNILVHTISVVFGLAGIVCLLKDWGGIIVPAVLFAGIAILQEIRITVMKRIYRIMLDREEEMRRQQPDLFLPVRDTVFTDTEIVGLKTGSRYDYKSVIKVMESENYVILVMRGMLFIPVLKATLEGGSVKEFKSFIEARRKAAQNA